MASDWQEAAAQQAEEVSARLRQLLSTGLGLLHSKFGLELGLQPQLYPSWVFLAVPAFLGLLILLLLLHCASSSRGKPAARVDRDPPVLLPKAATAPAKPVKAEEAKKKGKKKPQADKAKPNGRPVELAEEAAVITAVKKENPKQSVEADKKNEKVKKIKKKSKADIKSPQSSSKDKEEPEEGNWETKISNKEKRQQRKRDKGADSDSFPEAATSVSESYTTVPSQSASIRKTKVPSELSAVNGGGWNEKPTKVIPSQALEEKWAPTATTAGKKKNEPCTWNQDAVDTNGKDWSAPWSERSIFPSIAPWTAVETRIAPSEQRPPHFSTISLNSSVSASVSDSVPQANVADSQWDAAAAEPNPDDEWSGHNGLSSGEAGSDWNPPAEEWGNYGEEEPVSAPQKEEPEQKVPKISDEEKEKEEITAPTAAGSKSKKKKKKKKQGEESGSPTQEAEVAREAVKKEVSISAPPPVVLPPVSGKSKESKGAVKETRTHSASVSEKSPSSLQLKQESSSAPAKQNSVPPLQSQVKSEESWESPKQVKKKKKARRET